MMRNKYYIVALFLLLGGVSSSLQAHGYVFARSNEEMRDDIKILLGPAQMILEYQAVYQGQIAPHVRLMMDKNQDNFLFPDEVEQFVRFFVQDFNRQHREHFVEINGQFVSFHLDSLAFPGIETDSLLAPLKVFVRLHIEGYNLPDGKNQLHIDPRFFFLIGDHFIRLAKQYVAFTDEQEAKIGRYLQIELYGSRSLRFTRTFPGRIRRNKKSIYIYGVFYDQNLKKLHQEQIPWFRVEMVRE